MKKNKIFMICALILSVMIICAGTVMVFSLLSDIQTQTAAQRQQSNSLARLQNAEELLRNNQTEAIENWLAFTTAMDNKMDTAALGINRTDLNMAELMNLSRTAGFNSLAIYSKDGKFLEGTICPYEDVLEVLFDGSQSTLDVHDDQFTLWLCRKLADRRYLVASRVCTDFYLTQQSMGGVKTSAEQYSIGKNGFMLILNKQFKTVVYSPDDFSPARIGAEFELDTSDSYFTTIDDVRYAYAVYDGELYTFIALVPWSEINTGVMFMVSLLTSLFLVVVISITLYILFVSIDLENQGAASKNAPKKQIFRIFGLKINRYFYYKARNVILLALVSLFAVSVYAQMLTTLSDQHFSSLQNLRSVDDLLKDNDSRIAELSQQFAQDYTERAQEIALLLKKNHSLLKRSNVVRLANAQGVKTLYIFDGNGHTEVTNDVYDDFTLSDNPDDQSYAFWSIIRGYQEVLVQEPQSDNTMEHRMMQYTGVRRQDAQGMVQVGTTPEMFSQRLAHTRLSQVLSKVSIENNGFLFAVNRDTEELEFWPDSRSMGRNVSTVGLTSAALKDNYSGWQRLDGQEYYVNTLLHNNTYLVVAVPLTTIYSNVMQTSALVTVVSNLISLVVVLLLSALFRCLGHSDEEGSRNSPFFTIIRGNRTQTVQDVTSRWNGTVVRFNELGAEQKLGRIISFMLVMIGASLLVYRYISERWALSPLLNHIFSQNWERSLNIFSLSYSFIVLLDVYLAVLVLRLSINWFSMGQGSRSETVARLLQNFAKYAATIGSVLYCLQFLGVDSSTVLTGSGILALGVSLGAQSLVSDILAGIFIVFEGEFRVGDIITVGDFRGIVAEIGIRTTKVDQYGNMKIFRNSEISGVLNMTQQSSYAYCFFDVAYEEDLERIERILAVELPTWPQRIPELLKTPDFAGVAELAASGVTLRIDGTCSEADRLSVIRKMNREAKIMCDNYHIDIPFPQVTVHQASETAREDTIDPLATEPVSQ